MYPVHEVNSVVCIIDALGRNRCLPKFPHLPRNCSAYCSSSCPVYSVEMILNTCTDEGYTLWTVFFELFNLYL